MVGMNLVQVRAREFFPQLVRLVANERHVQPGVQGAAPR